MKITANSSASFYQRFRQSALRNTIWPIRSFELFKFTPMAALMFVILINGNIVRSLKDSLVHATVGSEVISFIKLWGELPLGILFVMFYTKLCRLMTTENAFRVIFVIFLSFYIIFAFILYPYKAFFHPDPALVQRYVESYPHFKWFIIMWGEWSLILVYIMGELWPLVVFSLLFWQLANKITKTEEASRFYPFFSLFGQANCLIAGSVVIYFASKHHFLIPLFAHLTDTTEVMIKSNITIVIFTGIIALLIHFYIDKKIIARTLNLSNKSSAKEEKKSKIKLMESFIIIAKSPYLQYLTVILLSYSFAINLIEGITMYKYKQLYKSADLLMNLQGRVLFWTGALTILCSFIGSSIIRRLGWKVAAILTPLVALICGVLFFGSIIFNNSEQLFTLAQLKTPLVITVFFGALQFILIKGMKYSLYDTTKEMAYIPLSEEEKTSGKAAVDIVGAKIGKSAGSIIQIAIFSFFPSTTYDNVAGLLMSFFVLVCLGWVFAVIKLSKYYEDKVVSDQP